MDCTHEFYTITDYSTRVCMGCGLEQRTGIEAKCAYTLNQPLWVGYNRVNRFRKILNMLFDPGKYGSIPGKVFLQMKNMEKFDNVPDMCKALKILKSKAKNYNAVHLYAKYFLKQYTSVTPPLTKVRNDIIGDFAIIEKGMKAIFPKKRFFSYRWLLIRLLKKHKLSTFVTFVKPLVSKAASARYSKMFDQIMIASTIVAIPGSLPGFV